MAFLRQEHRDHLKTSGLTDATIDAAHIYTVEDPEKSKAMTGMEVGSGIAYCHLSTDGKRLFYQFRPDNPWQAEDGKPVKYVTRKGTTPGAYLPPIIDRAKFLDASQPIWVTEGCKKALSLAQEGVLAVALAGVWNWRNPKSEGKKAKLHDSLRNLGIEGREFVVCFDSDIAGNENIQAAEVQLAKLLMQAGGKVKCVRIPPSGDGKVGIDDYLLQFPEQAAKKAAVEGLYAAAKAPEIKTGLSEKEMEGALRLNARYAYVLDTDKVYDLRTGTWMTLSAFARGKEPYAKAWVSDHFRLDRATYTTVQFSPAAEVPPETLNLYRPERMLKYTGSRLMPQSCPPQAWDLILNLADGDAAVANHLLDKVAYIVQRPGRPITGTILKDSGTGGTGKTTFFALISRLCSPFSQTLSHRQMAGNFNSYLADNILLTIPECKSDEDRDFLEHVLREFVLAGADLTINQKHQPERRAKSHAAWFVSTNYDIAITLPKYDRRWEVFQSDRKLDPKLGEWIGNELGKLKSDFVQEFYNFLRERDLSKFIPMGILDTPARQRMIEDSRKSIEVWWDECQTERGPLPPGRITSKEAYVIYLSWMEAAGYKRPYALNRFAASAPKGWNGRSNKGGYFDVPDFGQPKGEDALPTVDEIMGTPTVTDGVTDVTVGDGCADTSVTPKTAISKADQGKSDGCEGYSPQTEKREQGRMIPPPLTGFGKLGTPSQPSQPSQPSRSPSVGASLDPEDRIAELAAKLAARSARFDVVGDAVAKALFAKLTAGAPLDPEDEAAYQRLYGRARA